MKGLNKLLLIIVVTLAVAVPAQADTDIKVSGQVRLRKQFEDKSFDTSAAGNQFADMRTRVNVKATVDDNTHGFVQFQDSRIAGANSLSGTLNDGKNVDLHQAFIQIDNIFGEGWGGKAGRFEFSQGNQRVLSACGWCNVGRSWEGGMLWYDNPDFKVTGFGLKRLELQDPGYNRDFDIFGLYADVKALENADFDLFGFYEYDADTNGYLNGINKLDRINVGLYYKRHWNQFDFELNGVYQTGKQPSGTASLDTTVWGNPHLPDSVTIDTVTVGAEVDISAFMFTFEVGYNFSGAGNARVAAGIDYASGDDGSDTTKCKTYNNLYYGGHKFHGYMDYFCPGAVAGKAYADAGLMDLMLRGKVDPVPGWTIKGDLHYFQSAEKYIDPMDTLGLTATTDVGIEFDLTVSTTRVAGVNLMAGASVFLPEEAFADMKDPDPGFWVWSMATLNFGK